LPTTYGSGVKYLDRKSSRPVTWVIKIKHAGLGVLGQNRKENYELFILDSCTNFSACSILIYGTVGMKPSPMSDEFHDWLESCPVQWFRGEVTKDHVAYYFETPDEDEE